MSRTGGQVRTSTAAEASFDLSSLQMSCVVITHTDRLTCTIQCRQTWIWSDASAGTSEENPTFHHTMSSPTVWISKPHFKSPPETKLLNSTACEIYSKVTAARALLPPASSLYSLVIHITFILSLIFPERWLVSQLLQAVECFAPFYELNMSDFYFYVISSLWGWFVKNCLTQVFLQGRIIHFKWWLWA